MTNGVGNVSNGTATCGAEKCCRNNPSQNEDGYTTVLYETSDFVPYQPTQEPIFPPELQLYPDLDQHFLTFTNDRVKWFRPTTLQQFLELKQSYQDAKIVVGNTELGVEVKFKHCQYPVYINPSSITEMTQV